MKSLYALGISYHLCSFSNKLVGIARKGFLTKKQKIKEELMKLYSVVFLIFAIFGVATVATAFKNAMDLPIKQINIYGECVGVKTVSGPKPCEWLKSGEKYRVEYVK